MIGERPILLLTRLLAQIEEKFHKAVDKPVRRLFFLRLEYADDFRHLGVNGTNLGEVRRVEGSCARRDLVVIDIDFLRQREEVADGERRVEIVVHRFIERRLGFQRRRQERLRAACALVLARREFCGIVPRISEAREARLRLRQALVGEIERTAVVRLHDEKAHDLPRVFLQNVLDGEEVVFRLRHLLVMDRDEAVVQPVASEAVVVARACLRLCDLVLVMREDEIAAAAVEVERLAQILHRHR